MTLFIKSTHTCGQSWSKAQSNPYLKTLCLWTPSGTFAAFSKFHLNTPKSPNIKGFQFFKGHNFHIGWHFRFCVEKGGKLGQLQNLLFTGPLQNPNFAWRSYSKHWEKHRMTFVKVLEGTSQYKFCFSRKFRPVQFFEEKRGQTGVDWGIPGRPAPWRSGVPVHTARPRLSSASGPTGRIPRLRAFPRPRAPRLSYSEASWSPHTPRAASTFASDRSCPRCLCRRTTLLPAARTPLCSSRSHEGSCPSRL
jgi:hypothetical protein